MAGPIRQCALCLQVAELKNSHLIPAGVYRVCRDSTAANPNPMLLESNRRPYHTSQQTEAHLLCFDCEQLLSRNGENWVLKQMNRVTSFRLLDAANASPVVWDDGKWRVVDLRGHRNFRPSDLVHFAIGVVWRSAVWPEPERRVELGPYKEGFRRFLTGEVDLPRSVSIQIQIDREHSRHLPLASFPTTARIDSAWGHEFFVPGILFHVIIGEATANLARHVDVREGRVAIFDFDDHLERGLWPHIRKMLANPPDPSL